ncbi:MAG: cytochrome b/b6 domain-containing protein [Pseudomonadota bacterium]
MAQLKTYGWVDKTFHWLVVLNLSATLIGSPGMASLPLAERALEYGDHGASVTTLAILMMLRLVWRLFHPFPPLPDSMTRLEKYAAKTVHWGLYALIFAQIGIGLLLASTTEVDFVPSLYNLNYTALGLVPVGAHDTLLTLHNIGYWAIVAAIAIHVLAALKHALIDRDGVLTRMLPFVKARRPG